MKEKEFNLSEKQQTGGNFDYSCELFYKGDVKEFLKILKQNLNERRVQSTNPPFRRGLRWVEFEINKLAGDKLTKQD